MLNQQLEYNEYQELEFACKVTGFSVEESDRVLGFVYYITLNSLGRAYLGWVAYDQDEGCWIASATGKDVCFPLEGERFRSAALALLWLASSRLKLLGR